MIFVIYQIEWSELDSAYQTYAKDYLGYGGYVSIIDEIDLVPVIFVISYFL